MPLEEEFTQEQLEKAQSFIDLFESLKRYKKCPTRSQPDVDVRTKKDFEKDIDFFQRIEERKK